MKKKFKWYKVKKTAGRHALTGIQLVKGDDHLLDESLVSADLFEPIDGPTKKTSAENNVQESQAESQAAPADTSNTKKPAGAGKTKTPAKPADTKKTEEGK